MDVILKPIITIQIVIELFVACFHFHTSITNLIYLKISRRGLGTTFLKNVVLNTGINILTLIVVIVVVCGFKILKVKIPCDIKFDLTTTTIYNMFGSAQYCYYR